MRARRTVGHVLALALLGASPLLSAGDDPSRRLAGTWGLPPDDANPYASGFGSYFSLISDGSGQTQARVFLYAKGWDCRQDGPLTWNAALARFEWPNGSSDAKEKVCWLSAEPLGERLKVAIRCSYQCTDRENTHEQVLDRIAEERLEPPPGVSAMFCASHDALRRALCHPGPLHESVGEALRRVEQLRVLGHGDGEPADSGGWGADTKKALLRILAACHAGGGEASCLKARVDDEARRLEVKVAETQQALAEERGRSRAAEARIERSNDRLGWEGTWFQDNDELFTSLTIEHCAAEGCDLSFNAETNSAFGCTGDPDSESFQCRTGSCWLESAPFRFTRDGAAYGYVEPHSDDRNEAGAGPFANYCRFDLARGEGRVRLDLTGIGCRWLCTNAPVEPLRGEYRPPEKPSFDCGKDPSDLALDERAICLDAELAALDRDLAKAFARTKAALKGAARDALFVSQRSFLKQRRACEGGSGHRACLLDAYRGRLKELGT